MWFTVFFFFAGVPLGYLVRKQPLAIRLAGFVSVWSVRVAGRSISAPSGPKPRVARMSSHLTMI